MNFGELHSHGYPSCTFSCELLSIYPNPVLPKDVSDIAMPIPDMVEEDEGKVL